MESKNWKFVVAFVALIAVSAFGVSQLVGAYSGGNPTYVIENWTGDLVQQGGEPLGGLIHNVAESFDAGIKVNGTEVINSSGVWTGAFSGTTISGTTGTFSSTLGVTGLFSAVNASISGDMEFTSNNGDLYILGDISVEDITASGTIDIVAGAVSGVTSLTSTANFFTNASVSNAFSVGGEVQFGSVVASGSGFDLQVVSDNTSTSSLDFDSGGSKGTCFQLRDTTGATVYCRVNGGGTSLACNTVSCK